jgi:hypothetical protein
MLSDFRRRRVEYFRVVSKYHQLFGGSAATGADWD